ncbi:MAG TPA: AAA family ATPase [Gemmatimonadales bacterium]|nr:AAA family ATPase [Gemmatimonadales bacterium]
MATPGTLRTALISTDARFREQFRELSHAPASDFAIGLEISEPFGAFGEQQVRSLRQLNPQIVVIDLEDDPELGVKFTQFLSEMNPGQRVVAVGPHLSPEQLLAAMRAGVADYLHKPVEEAALRGAMSRVAQSLGVSSAKGGVRVSRLYSFFSPKGGSGSTSVATNVAVVLHRLTGKKTLLVDLDLELGEVALLLGVQPRFNFVDMVKNFHRMDAGLLASYIEQHPSGIHLLSAPFHPERAEVVSADDIRRILHFLKQHYDYVVVDTPGSFSPSTLAAFDQSDQVFVVTNLDLPSLRNIQRGLPMLKRVLPKGEEQIRMVVNRYSSDSQISLADVERTIGIKVFATISNDYEALIQSINSGKPIVLNGTSKYSRDVKALGGRIAGLTGDFLDDQKGGNWVGRVLGKLRRNEEAKQ